MLCIQSESFSRSATSKKEHFCFIQNCFFFWEFNMFETVDKIMHTIVVFSHIHKRHKSIRSYICKSIFSTNHVIKCIKWSKWNICWMKSLIVQTELIFLRENDVVSVNRCWSSCSWATDSIWHKGSSDSWNCDKIWEFNATKNAISIQTITMRNVLNRIWLPFLEVDFGGWMDFTSRAGTVLILHDGPPKPTCRAQTFKIFKVFAENCVKITPSTFLCVRWRVVSCFSVHFSSLDWV